MSRLSRPSLPSIQWLMQGYVALLFLVALFPTRLAFRVARQIGRARYDWQGGCLDEQTNHVVERLGETPEKARRWLRRAFELTAFEDLECWLYPRMSKASLSRFITFRGMEHLLEALAGGKGAVLYTGHARSVFTLVVGLGLLGYRVNPIIFARTPGLSGIRRWFYDRRIKVLETSLGCEIRWMYPPQPWLAVLCANALRRNEIVIALVDYSFSHESADVRFLNADVAIPLGPALLAKSTGAPLLDVWLHRPEATGPLVAEIGFPIEPSSEHAVTVQRMAGRLEAEIRRDPSTWAGWLFRLTG